MIQVSRLDGEVLYLNYFQILTIELIPETKIMLNNGRYYLVKDSIESIQKQITLFLHSCFTPETRELVSEGRP